ncbi:TetR/AcrR family transcriptional regulator [Paenibacillus sp. 481]|uniref:TetR/AcrR family transcriptional regulator n=1 Tax=Paenibacillus sp. 481 TaxID=2835869 RepID=UPI001E3D8E28|nr:TetR/AcrR family transcriptional regulator [Paenibacillus sp. 481]UHA71882.1 helix-turn-helix transcriptional regulator [Paenibacillus sp. 481]
MSTQHKTGKKEKDDKRKRLIDAAYNVFVKKGYLNASIKDIAKEADMTSGLVHYYFKNKEELLLSVQEDVQKQYQKQYQNQYQHQHEEQPVSLKSIHVGDVFGEIKSRAEQNPDWYRWRYEIFSLGIKSESGQLEQEVASILQNGRDSLSTPLQRLVGESRSQHADALASILLACFDGLALQKIVDDKLDFDKSYAVLTELVELYLNQSKPSN